MKMLKHFRFKQIIMGVFFALFSISTYAHNDTFDYVITSSGETINCVISKNFWGGIRFKLPSENSYKAMDPNLIKEYYTSSTGETFRSFKIPETDNMAFMKQLEKGRINLYELKSRRYRSNNIFWFAKKGMNSLIEVKNTIILQSDGPKKVDLIKLISDDEPTLKKIDNEDYTFDSIRKAISEYNTDTNGEKKIHLDK